MIKVMMVDKDPLIGMALARLIGTHKKIDVVATTGFQLLAVDGARKHRPNVIVVDFDDSFSQGLQLVGRFRRTMPEIGIVGLVGRFDHPVCRRLLELGVKGLVSKKVDVEDVQEIIMRVRRGEHAIDPEIAQQLALAQLPGQAVKPFDRLTDRELEVALLLIEDERMTVIAKMLGVSPKTVATYKYRSFEKLNVQGPVGLFKLALRYELVELEPSISQVNLF